MVQTRRILRRGIGRPILFGSFTIFGPVLLSLLVLTLRPFDFWSIVIVSLCALALYFFSLPLFSFIDALDLRGGQLSFRRLISRRWIQKRLRELLIVRLVARLSTDEDGQRPRFEFVAASLHFIDNSMIFVPFDEFPGAWRLLSKFIKEPQTGFAFPLKLAGLALSEVHRHQGAPELGQSAGYNHPDDMTMTLYVYDHGKDVIPDGQSPVLQEELEHAKQGIMTFWSALTRGQIQIDHLEDRRLSMVSETDKDGVYSDYAIRLPEQTQRTRVYLTAVRGRFIKLRLTARWPLNAFDEQCQQIINQLKDELQEQV